MRKIIVTLCSVALTCAGTLGVNQLSLNNNDAINTNSDNTAVVQYADKAEEQNSLTADNNAEAVIAPAKDTTDQAEVAAPVETKAEDKSDVKATKKEAAKDVVTEAKKEVEDSKYSAAPTQQKASISKETQNTAAKKSQAAVQNTATKKSQEAVQKAPQTTAQNSVKKTPVSGNAVNNTAKNTAASNGKNAYVYKNVDLSQCDNTQEVVKVLQSNGFDNINMGNVNQISSLDDILALINGNGSNNNSTTVTTPTKQPTPTTKPVQPTPTTKPSQTTPTPTKTPSNNTNTSVSSYANQVLQLVNQERAKAGLSALTTNATLQAAADKRAQETVQSFSHTRPNGTSFSTVLKEYGISYRAAGENIAYGQKTPQEVVNAWMNSSGHRANILGANFGKVGIGVYQKNGVIYWSQLFTN